MKLGCFFSLIEYSQALLHNHGKIWFFIFFAVLIMRIFDAHTHLNQEDLFPNRKEHLEAFAGV